MQGRWEGEVTRDQRCGGGRSRILRHAAAHRVPLLYEPLNRYETNLFNRLGDFAGPRDVETRNVESPISSTDIEEADRASLRVAGPLIRSCAFRRFEPARHRLRTYSRCRRSSPRSATWLRGYLSAEILPLPDSAAAARERQFMPRRAVS
jgi:hypothetical protein